MPTARITGEDVQLHTLIWSAAKNATRLSLLLVLRTTLRRFAEWFMWQGLKAEISLARF